MEFRSLCLSNIAAILRAALVTSTVFHTLLPIWDAALNGDEISLLDLQSGDCNRFDTPAMILTMRKAIDHAFLPDCGHRQWQSLMKTAFAHADNLTQKRIAEELKRLGGLFNAEDFFNKRMQRWYALLSSAGQTWWHNVGHRVLAVFNGELAIVKPCVKAAVLKTLLNGWCTTRRFQGQQQGCLFHCGSGEDSIEHYLCCSSVSDLWRYCFYGQWGPTECRLVVGCKGEKAIYRHAFFIYGIFRAFHNLRHNTGDLRGSQLHSMVRCYIRAAISESSPAVQKHIGGMGSRFQSRYYKRFALV